MSEPLTSREYAATGGDECPWCHSQELEGGQLEADFSMVWQDITCQNCGKTWTDEYTLTGYTPIEET